MTEHLFDPAPFGGAPREKRSPKIRVHPDDAERVPAGDGRWRVLAGRRGVTHRAHLLDRYLRALCGEYGRPLGLQGTRPPACPECLARDAENKEAG